MNIPSHQVVVDGPTFTSAVLYTGEASWGTDSADVALVPTQLQQDPAVVEDQATETNDLEFRVREIKVGDLAHNEWIP